MEDGKDFCILPSKVNSVTGHAFKRTTFKKPTYCHHCSEFLWGIALQGVKCLICSFVAHEKCEANIVTYCYTKAPSQVQIPQSHTLIKFIDDKKKFCNVCRSKLDDTDGFECTVCQYYIHKTCVKNIVHNCKIYHCYCSYTGNFKCKQHHHWSEGHLPLNSKCKVCQKICASVECLTGMRCSWCLTTVHSFCLPEYHQNCSFGILRTCMLPPQVVKHFHLDIVTSQPGSPVKVCPCPQVDKIDTHEASGNEEQTKSVCIYQGSIDDENKIFRQITVNDCMSTADALVNVLEKFNIGDEPAKYYLTKYKYDKSEVKLDEEEKIWAYTNEEDEQDFFLRNVHLDKEELKITLHAGLINTYTASIDLVINIMSNASDIILAALKQFKLPIENPEKYCITRMKVTPSNVKEVIIENNESIYNVLVEKRRLSIQELHNTRFYLQPKVDEVEVLSLFINNLPWTDITADDYKTNITNALGKWDENMNIVAVFPIFGSIVIEFNGLECYKEYAPLFQNLVIENKSIKTLLLTEINQELLPRTTSPLIIYVNSKSGGGQGYKIFVKLKRLLNPYQVIDILEDGPLPMLYMLRHLRHFRILVCGGDGTVGWVLSCLEGIREKLACQDPPTAILPLGTGNDLSRVLNWGAGYSGEPCLEVLQQVLSSNEVKLDRWSVTFDASNDDPVSVVPMTNYFGVGMDAKISLEFHLSREENPEKFNSRFRNKGVYLKAGLKNLNSSTVANLQEKLSIEVDGVNIDLPYVEGIAVNNISSWCAGGDPWGNDPDPNFKPQNFNDGLLEVIGITGVSHIGKIYCGLSTGIHIAQGSLINIKIKDCPLPVQVDGEPWMQDPGSIMISPAPHPARMLSKLTAPSRRVSNPFPPFGRNEQREIKHRTATAPDWNMAARPAQIE